MKLSLFEVKKLIEELYGIPGTEIKGLLTYALPFKLKFRIETKIVPNLRSAEKMIEEQIKKIALDHGAEDNNGIWQFKLDDKKMPIDKEKFQEFHNKCNEFLRNTNNEIEFEDTIPLSYFEDLKIDSHYPILCKLITE